MRHFTALLSLVLATCLNISASSTDTAFIDTTRPTALHPEFDIHVGTGASTIIQNYASQVEGCSDFFLTPGCRIVFGAGFGMPVRDFLSLNTGLDIAINNYNYSMSILDTPKGTLNSIYNRSHYVSLEIPLFIQLRFNLGSHIRWTNDIGMYYSRGLTGKSRYRAYISSTNDLGQSQVSETRISQDYYNPRSPIIAGAMRTDWGIHLATGIVYKRHLSLKCVMRTGLRNTASNLDVLDIANHNLSATFLIGYTF